MIKWFKSLFAWRLIGLKSGYAYFENDITKKRSARKSSSLPGIVDDLWLQGINRNL